jgi:DNA-binding HxlR family transcriptional regulator
MKKGKPAAAALSKNYRSPCPVACTLDLIGDRWTLLVVRDMVLGRKRFKEFVSSPEGIPTNILAERLARLTVAGIIRHAPSDDGTKHQAYELTPKGRALLPVLKGLRNWGLKWVKGTSAKMKMAGEPGALPTVSAPSPQAPSRSRSLRRTA